VNCEMEGRCELGFRFGSGLCALASVDLEAWDSGDCIRMSPPWHRGCGVHEVAGDVCDRSAVRSNAFGRYKGLRIGHEIPACSRTSAYSQRKVLIDPIASMCTFRCMLEREADNVIRDTKIQLAGASRLANQLL
jgi:hypothetical protein